MNGVALHEKSFATVKSFQDKEKRWDAWIQYRLDTLEKFEVYADQQIAELNEAREKRCVGAITDVVVKDYKKYLVKTRKKKRKWGGVRSAQVDEVPCNGVRNKGCRGRKVSRRHWHEVCNHAGDGQSCRTLRRGAYYQGPEVLRSAPEKLPIGFGPALASLV
jgi:hypothetical protein